MMDNDDNLPACGITGYVVLPIEDFKRHSPAAVAMAAVAPFKSIDEVWQTFGDMEALWVAAMDAGAQFHRVGGRYGHWEGLPPSHALTADEARAVVWGRQVLWRTGGGANSPFIADRLFDRTWSLDFAAGVLGIPSRRMWTLFRDGGIGGFKLGHGRVQVSISGVRRYQRERMAGEKSSPVALGTAA